MSTRAPFALIWTQADHAQGMGDLFSSLAIARALRRRGRCTIVAVNEGSFIKTLPSDVQDYLLPVASASSPAALREMVRAYDPAVLVLNRMANGPRLLDAAVRSASVVVSIDDRGPDAALVPHRLYPLYPPSGFRGPRGPAIVPLGNRPRRAHRSVPVSADRVLVTQGGADTQGFTPLILRAIGDLPRLSRIDVVLGPLFRHERQLAAALASIGGKAVVHRNPPRFHDLMRRASLAITAGGLTLFELAYLGVPSVTVANERFEVATAALFDAQGATVNLGYGGDLRSARLRGAVERLAADSVRRRRMARDARRLVDGRGAERIADLVTQWGRS